MDAISPVHMLSEILQESDRKLCEGRQEAVDRPCVSTTYDMWPLKFCEETGYTLHSGTSRPEA